MTNLELSENCRERLLSFQIVCGALMQEKRGVVDDETFEMLGRAYSMTGNAAYEIGNLLKEIKELNS